MGALFIGGGKDDHYDGKLAELFFFWKGGKIQKWDDLKACYFFQTESI